MSKSLITRVWLGGLAALVAGLVIAGFGIALMSASGGTFQRMPMMHYGYYVSTQDSTVWLGLSGIILGGTTVVIGAVAQLVAWVGAVINTNRLADKTWFTVLLVGGVIGLFAGFAGFAVMVAYVVAGPDGMAESARPGTLAPTA